MTTSPKRAGSTIPAVDGPLVKENFPSLDLTRSIKNLRLRTAGVSLGFARWVTCLAWNARVDLRSCRRVELIQSVVSFPRSPTGVDVRRPCDLHSFSTLTSKKPHHSWPISQVYDTGKPECVITYCTLKTTQNMAIPETQTKNFGIQIKRIVRRGLGQPK